MIYWKDFLLDNEIGPVLEVAGNADELSGWSMQENAVSNGNRDKKGRRRRLGSTFIMEDENGTKNEALSASIQETGQEQRPARMVGLSGLESNIAEAGMEAGRGNRVQELRRRGEG